MKDAKIVDLYWKRSERAISESRSKYGRFLHAVAYGISHSREDADESDGRTQVGRFVSTEAVTGKQGALMAKQAHPRAVSAFKSFLKGKKGYYLITRLGGSGQPVVLWSKHRLGGYTANIVSNSKLYAYEKGKVELVNTVANGSSGEWLTTYKGKLRFGDYRSRNYVTVRNGTFQGACYSVKWTKGGKASYWKQKIVNGKKLGAKKRVGAKLGEKRVYESLGKALKFMKLPKAAKEHTQTQMEGRFRVLRS